MHIQTISVLGAFALGFTTLLPAQGKVSFKTHIYPILSKSCLKCHKGTYKDSGGRTRKPKSDLRLDGKGWILKGGKNGVAVVPGSPDKSPLYTLAILDPDDDDIMPAKGAPLTKKQTDLIRRWIAEGSDFGSWVGKAGPGAAIVAQAQNAAKDVTLTTSRLKVWDQLSKGMKLPLPQAVERAAGQKCQVVPVTPGSPLLRVTFVSNESSVGDSDLANLIPLAGHITQLGLGKTRISDVALASVSRMKLLTRLDLNRTVITDEGLATISQLSELRYLNLHSTAVTDDGIRELGKLTNLESIYLWNTEVSAEGVRTLSKLLPKAKISHRLQIPVLEKPKGSRNGSNTRRKRRKK
jgi:hypothetical protein